MIIFHLFSPFRAHTFLSSSRLFPVLFFLHFPLHTRFGNLTILQASNKLMQVFIIVFLIYTFFVFLLSLLCSTHKMHILIFVSSTSYKKNDGKIQFCSFATHTWEKENLKTVQNLYFVKGVKALIISFWKSFWW